MIVTKRGNVSTRSWSGKSAVFLMESAPTSHGSSKSNKKNVRGISDYLFRNLQWFIIINSLLKKVQYMNILQRNCTKDNSHKIIVFVNKWQCIFVFSCLWNHLISNSTLETDPIRCITFRNSFWYLDLKLS